MQGEYPLPDNVIQKFAQTGGELCKNVFLLSEEYFVSFMTIVQHTTPQASPEYSLLPMGSG